MLDGMGRQSPPIPDISTSYKYNPDWAQVWFERKEDNTLRPDQETDPRQMWEWYEGDTTRRPNRNVMLSGWLSAIDRVFVELFVHDPSDPNSAPEEVEMLVGQFAKVRAIDAEKLSRARSNYTARVVNLTKKMAKVAEDDATLSDEEKALWDQMPLKVSIVLNYPHPDHERRPWFPLLTRSVYKMIIRRLRSVEAALTEVSDLILKLIFGGLGTYGERRADSGRSCYRRDVLVRLL